jgi:hypothetical protein
VLPHAPKNVPLLPPKVAVPKLNTGTFKPDPPSSLYSIDIFSCPYRFPPIDDRLTVQVLTCNQQPHDNRQRPLII